MKRSKAKQRLRSHINAKHSKDQQIDVDNSPNVAIDAMDSISDSNASLLETAKAGATLLKCYGSSLFWVLDVSILPLCRIFIRNLGTIGFVSMMKLKNDFYWLVNSTD